MIPYFLFFFFFNDTATTEIYTLSLHDALPILELDNLDLVGVAGDDGEAIGDFAGRTAGAGFRGAGEITDRDRKSTRLNSSHSQISYAVFCLKKKKKKK